MTTDTLHDQLLALIVDSIIECYDGDLRKEEDDTANVSYTPLDTTAIRGLLTSLWGEHVSAQTIECAYETLINDGAEEWPHAWCEEDEDDIKHQRISNLDREIECAENHLATLKQEQDDLIDAVFPRGYAKEQEYHQGRAD